VSIGDVANLLTAIGTLIAAGASIIGVLMAFRNSQKIEEVHVATNGMKAELVRVTGDAKYAEGREQGENYPRVRDRSQDE
jgi:hypothetical protein